MNQHQQVHATNNKGMIWGFAKEGTIEDLLCFLNKDDKKDEKNKKNDENKKKGEPTINVVSYVYTSFVTIFEFLFLCLYLFIKKIKIKIRIKIKIIRIKKQTFW